MTLAFNFPDLSIAPNATATILTHANYSSELMPTAAGFILTE
jgi:hypothetical protein